MEKNGDKKELSEVNNLKDTWESEALQHLWWICTMDAVDDNYVILCSSIFGLEFMEKQLLIK